MANKINRAYWSFSEQIEIPIIEQKEVASENIRWLRDIKALIATEKKNPITSILRFLLGSSGSQIKKMYKYSNPDDLLKEVNEFIAKNKIKKILKFTDTCEFYEIADYGCDNRGEFPIKPCGGIELVWVESSEE